MSDFNPFTESSERTIPDFFDEFKNWFAENYGNKYDLHLRFKGAATSDPNWLSAFYALSSSNDKSQTGLYISELLINNTSVHQILITQNKEDIKLVSYGDNIYKINDWKKYCVIYKNDYEVAKDFVKFVNVNSQFIASNQTYHPSLQERIFSLLKDKQYYLSKDFINI